LKLYLPVDEKEGNISVFRNKGAFVAIKLDCQNHRLLKRILKKAFIRFDNLTFTKTQFFFSNTTKISRIYYRNILLFTNNKILLTNKPT